MNFKKYLLRSVPVIALAVGGFVGYGFGSRRAFEDLSTLDERNSDSSSMDSASTPRGDHSTLEGNPVRNNRDAAENTRMLLEKQNDLEKQLLESRNENNLLKEKFESFQKKAGFYDFSNLKEPEGINFEEKFRKSPEFYLGNPGKKYEDLISMIEFAVVNAKEWKYNSFFSDEEYTAAEMKFYSLGEMSVFKRKVPTPDVTLTKDYSVDIDIKKDLSKVEPFAFENEIRLHIEEYSIGSPKEDFLEARLNVYSKENDAYAYEAIFFYNKTKNELKLNAVVSKVEIEIPESMVKPSSNQKLINSLENIMNGIDYIAKDYVPKKKEEAVK